MSQTHRSRPSRHLAATGEDTLSLNTLALFEAAASLECPLTSRRDKTPFQPHPVFHGPQKEVPVEITGEVSPSGQDGGTGFMAPNVGVSGHAPVSTKIGTLRRDEARPALQMGRQSHDKCRDASAAGPGVTPFGG